MDGLDGGILNIAIASDSENEDSGATTSKTTTTRANRTQQTEEEFQAVKKTYVAKIEDGNIYKSITLPLPPDANKYHLLEVLHAVEELYFFRRFTEAVDFVQKVFDTEPESGGGLDEDTKATLVGYQRKCQQRLDRKS